MKKPYITKTAHNSITIMVPFEWVDTINNTQWATIIIAMETWAVWKTNVSSTHTGWEFSKEFTPEMIQQAFKKCSGETPEIILPN
ncbi:MAG: hypothetical protein ACOC2W_04300 [bacterium]